MTENDPAPSGPPAPGWWLASDGRYYPPQSATPPPQAPPPAPQSGKGCLIALAIVGALGLVAVILIAVVIWRVTSEVSDIADGITVGDIECPSEETVSDIVGHPVELAASGSILVASGCNYPSADPGAGAGVSIVSGSGLIAEEVLAELESEAQANGTEASSIDVGDDGKAFGSPSRSQAATKDDGQVVEVEIFAEGVEPIGEKKDEAAEILELFLELND